MRWSISTAVTSAPRSSIRRVSAPKPGPTSTIFSPFAAPASLTIQSRKFSSTRKFCPSLRLGSRPSAASREVSSFFFMPASVMMSASGVSATASAALSGGAERLRGTAFLFDGGSEPGKFFCDFFFFTARRACRGCRGAWDERFKALSAFFADVFKNGHSCSPCMVTR